MLARTAIGIINKTERKEREDKETKKGRDNRVKEAKKDNEEVENNGFLENSKLCEQKLTPPPCHSRN